MRLKGRSEPDPLWVRGAQSSARLGCFSALRESDSQGWGITLDDVDEAINAIFNYDKVSASYVGPENDADVYAIIKGGKHD